MPLLDLNTPTQLLLQWGWFLVTRANGVVFLLIIAVFVLGTIVRLPRARRDIASVEAGWTPNDDPGTTGGDA